MRKDNKEFQIKQLDQARLIREELAAIHIQSVLKYNLIQSSDENSIYKASKKLQQIIKVIKITYYNKKINVYQQEVISNEVTEC